MSARGKILRFIQENEPSYGSNGFYDPETGFGLYADGEVEAHVNKLLDAYAHELAEKIRKGQKEGHDQTTCVPCFVYGEAADLIDPEKEG